MENSILADHKSQMSTLADSQRRHQKSDGPEQKEAWEEAGCQVDANKIGTYEYHKRAKTYQVEVLLPVETVLKDWPASTRKSSG